MRLQIIVSATGVIAGAAASALTYSSLTAATTAAATTTRVTTRLGALVTGAGIRLILGPTTGRLAEAAIESFGCDLTAPTIETTGHTVAAVTSAAVGALVVATVSLLGTGAGYAFRAAVRIARGKQPSDPIESRLVDDQGLDCWVVETPRKQ
jgi:hypothetical protein